MVRLIKLRRPQVPANTGPVAFLADADSRSWPGIPIAKLGDYVLAIQEKNPRSEYYYFGTARYKAPEQFDYTTTDETTRVPRQPVSTASDIWGVRRIILDLMNSEPWPSSYTYIAGSVLPTSTNGAKMRHSKELCDLVTSCLMELPKDRPDCTKLWTDVRNYIETPDSSLGVALKYRTAAPQDNEVLHFRDDLLLTFAN